MIRQHLRAALAAIILALLSPISTAAELELSLAEDVFRGVFFTALDEAGRDGGTTLDLGLLLMEGESEDALLGHGSVLVYGDAGARRAQVQAGIGVRALFLDADPNITGMALALGGVISARVPDFNRIGFRAWGFVAPDVTSFEDLNDYLEFGLTLDYQIIRRAHIYAGYRKVRIEVDAGSADLDSGLHGGIRLNF